MLRAARAIATFGLAGGPTRTGCSTAKVLVGAEVYTAQERLSPAAIVAIVGALPGSRQAPGFTRTAAQMRRSRNGYTKDLKNETA